jgi:hypothetical protein
MTQDVGGSTELRRPSGSVIIQWWWIICQLASWARFPMMMNYYQLAAWACIPTTKSKYYRILRTYWTVCILHKALADVSVANLLATTQTWCNPSTLVSFLKSNLNYGCSPMSRDTNPSRLSSYTSICWGIGPRRNTPGLHWFMKWQE